MNPALKKQAPRWLWLVVVAMLLAIAANAQHSTTTDVPATTTVTAEMVVDALPADTLAQFCDAYALLGDAGLPVFEQKYTATEPPADEVFAEAASRC